MIGSIHDGKYHCVCCRLSGKKVPTVFPGLSMHETVILDTAEEALGHLLKHKSMCQYIPKYALNRLRKEIKENEKA